MSTDTETTQEPQSVTYDITQTISTVEIEPTDFLIDRKNLDSEWQKLPGKSFMYSEMAAKARFLLEELKRRGDAMSARYDGEIRRNPAAFGLEKVTEKGVEGKVTERIQNVLQEINEAALQHDLAQGACRAINDKRTALDNLTKLLSMNYYASK